MQNNSIETNDRNKIDELFYQYYFGETSEELRIPISEFYPPNCKLRILLNLKTKLPTIKKSYVKLLCKSKLFKDQFLTFLEDNFVKDYMNGRSNILRKLCIKMVSKKSNKKYKQPWTYMELLDAKK